MISVDTRQIREFEADLKTFAKKAYPFATKQTVNRAAFETRGEAQKLIGEKMIERNRYTSGSVRVEQARTLIVSRQEAIVGSLAEYMAVQEFGGMVKGGRQSRAIPTSYAAGLSRDSKPRTKLPRKPNKLASIRLANRRKGVGGRKARNAAAVMEAAKGGNKFVYLDLGRRRGIFRVTGGVRRPKVNMVWDMTRSSVRVPRNPWLSPATNKVQTRLPVIYSDALRFQLKRHNLFRG